MRTAEMERMSTIARIMRDHNITYKQAEPVADAEIRIEERKAELRVRLMEMGRF
jgi:hypothetical protein